MNDLGISNFNSIKVGSKRLSDDVALELQNITSLLRDADKEDVENALRSNNLKRLRQISWSFYFKDGIYGRLCRYMAFLYRYDWFVTPVKMVLKGVSDDKMVSQWYKIALFLENSHLKRTFGDIALKVVRDGCYYGYKIIQDSATYLQDLPLDYCRSRYELNGTPTVEFNVRYFDDKFSTDADYKERLLKMWPSEIRQAYKAYKAGKLPLDVQTDDRGWVLLDPQYAVKFNLNDSDMPLFIAVIPKLIDLAEAQDLDRKKMLQQLIRIIIQKMPLDKNSKMVFDMKEAEDLHKNATLMLKDAIGVNVLTTFADVDVADMSDRSNVSSIDQLTKRERSVYNAAGVAQTQFNSDSNMALEKSVNNDAATMNDLILRFEEYITSIIQRFNTVRGVNYSVQMLPTTIYNYTDLSDKYKNMATLGYSKLLPQVALGHPQSQVIMSAMFENKVLSLNDVFIPPQSSNTTSSNNATSGNGPGRPPLDDSKKSDKTIENIESS